MRPFLNKDFRRLRWLLRQKPPGAVRDYMIREVLALTKGVTDPEVTFPLKNVLQRIEMRMPFVISVLCFVSRMRKQDGGFTNWIPLGRRAFTILYRFFSRAAMSRTNYRGRLDMVYCLREVNRWDPGRGEGAPDILIEQKIIEGVPNLCTHVRVRVERLYAFFELPPDLSLPAAPPVRSIWELPPPPVSPPRPRETTSYYRRAPGFR